MLLLILISLTKQTINILKNKVNIVSLMPALWLISMLGVWLGESNTFFFPITFFGFMFIARLLPQEEK